MNAAELPGFKHTNLLFWKLLVFICPFCLTGSDKKNQTH